MSALGHDDPSATALAAAYDARAAEYAAVAGRIAQMDPRDVALVGSWAAAGVTGPVLDAGCGPGHWAGLLTDAGREVIGIDLSVRFIETARTAHPGVRFEVGSFLDLPHPVASVGGILAWYSLIHTPPAEVPAVLAEFARVLAPGGGLLLGFFDGEPGEPFAHAVAPAWFWSVDALTALLGDAGFSVVGSERRPREPGEISVRPHASLAAVRSA